MKKMKTLFERTFENHIPIIHNNVQVDCEWVLNGEGVPTRKLDGACCMIKDNVLFKRYDCKKGRIPPDDFVPADNLDKITGHWPGWVKCEDSNNSDKLFIEAFKKQCSWDDGTYELLGPKVNRNPDRYEEHVLVKHGSILLPDIERTFEGIKEFLEYNYIEGIVFHRENGDMCKIKRIDFGFEWNYSIVEKNRG